MTTDSRSASLPMFLAGLGAGIAVTLLIAPLSGAATRDLIRRRVGEGEDWAKDTATGLRDRVRDAANGAFGAEESRL